MKYILNLIKKLFSFGKESKPKVNKPRRRYIKDVKSGDSIRIEWSRIQGGIGFLKCINNDPETQKIFLEVTWGNYKETGGRQKEEIILRYDSKELANFNLLNPIEDDDDEVVDNFDLSALQKRMNDALEKEDYREAEKLQKRIDEILRKK